VVVTALAGTVGVGVGVSVGVGRVGVGVGDAGVGVGVRVGVGDAVVGVGVGVGLVVADVPAIAHGTAMPLNSAVQVVGVGGTKLRSVNPTVTPAPLARDPFHALLLSVRRPFA